MRALRLAAILVLGACTCRSSSPPSADLGARPPQSHSPTVPAERRAPTALDRYEAHLASPPAQREVVRRRALLAADGREQARRGERDVALRYLEDALEAGPTAALHREAGALALELDRPAVADAHLTAALALAIEPRERAHGLHERARWARRAGDLVAARAALREALAIRPSGALARELTALEPTDDTSGAVPAPPAAAPPAAEARDPAPDLAALCAHLGCSPEAEIPGDAEAPAVPAGWSGALELRLVGGGAPVATTWLAVRHADGWRSAGVVARRQVERTYGALDAEETVVATTADDDGLLVEVVGAVDERPEEAMAAFACADEHPNAAGARRCFEDATRALPPPDSWSFTLRFAERDGAIRLVERRPGPATQAD
ncbi:MAG: hypothetical protein CMN30_11100 [Sandaracinus sp.]|nr:hypothetical protein [Sandaracinus sp.]